MNGPFRVGEWLVQPLLHQMGGPRGRVKLEPRVMRLLLCLAERAPQTVSREELTEEVWDGAFVTDDVLTQSVSELRKAFRDDPKQPRFVPERLFEPTIAGLLDSRNNYAVTADGQRFLLRRPSSHPSPVNVVVNWTAELEHRP